MGIRKEREMKQDASDMARESFNREETEGVETWIVISSENLQDHNHPVIRQKSAITNGLFHFQCISHKLFHHCANWRPDLWYTANAMNRVQVVCVQLYLIN